MCGRFTNTAGLDAIQLRFDVEADEVEFEPRYNIAPTQSVPVVITENGRRALQNMRWGLVPSWAKDLAIGNRMINARAETLAEKPSFKRYFKRHRCIVPADGFYEWKKVNDGKQPVRITLKSGHLFGLAGLWAKWKDQQGEEIRTFTIITTTPNELLAGIHNRMPVILPADQEDRWLDQQNEDTGSLQQLLQPYPSGELQFYPVSTVVNNPRNDSRACIERLQQG